MTDNTTARGLAALDLLTDQYAAKARPTHNEVNDAIAIIRAALSRPVHGLEWGESTLIYNSVGIGRYYLDPNRGGNWAWDLGNGDQDKQGRESDEQSAKDALMEAAKEWLQGVDAALLSDQNAVHLNMLAGKIARPSLDQIVHIYGAEALTEYLGCKYVELSPLVSAAPAQPETEGAVETMARSLADLLGYDYDGLNDHSIADRGFPLWTVGQFGRKFQGGKQDLLRCAESFLVAPSSGYMQAPVEPSPMRSPHTKGVFEKPAPVWSDWIKWEGGLNPIPWAKGGEWGYKDAHNTVTVETWPSSRFKPGVWTHKDRSCAHFTSYRYRLDRAPSDWTPPTDGDIIPEYAPESKRFKPGGGE